MRVCKGLAPRRHRYRQNNLNNWTTFSVGTESYKISVAHGVADLLFRCSARVPNTNPDSIANDLTICRDDANISSEQGDTHRTAHQKVQEQQSNFDCCSSRHYRNRSSHLQRCVDEIELAGVRSETFSYGKDSNRGCYRVAEPYKTWFRIWQGCFEIELDFRVQNTGDLAGSISRVRFNVVQMPKPRRRTLVRSWSFWSRQ